VGREMETELVKSRREIEEEEEETIVAFVFKDKQTVLLSVCVCVYLWRVVPTALFQLHTCMQNKVKWRLSL